MKGTNQNIQFHYLYRSFFFPHRGRLKGFLLRMLKKEGKKVEVINYVFCDDAYLHQMNQQYLNHDTLTDIITFELSQKNQPLVADIYISIERIKENAKLFNVPFSKELLRVIFHGALHLAGYKDKKAEQKVIMRNKEDQWMEQFTVSRNTVSY